MENLITINYESEGPTVSGRELHEALGIETPYHKWFPRMCEYGFTEGEDYSVTDIFVHNPNGGKQTIADHQLTIPMAKELCMLQRNEKGKAVRRYFIKIEELWNSPEMIMKRALEIANANVKRLEERNKQLEADNEEMKPKADYFDRLVDRKLLTSFRATANEFGIGQKAFINWLLDHEYVYRDEKNKLLPYSEYVVQELFAIKEFAPNRSNYAGQQVLVTPKGRQYFKMLVLGK